MEYSALREAGLTDGEIKVYMALLKIGASTSGPIVDKSRVSRSIIYQILEKLIAKGLVSFIVRDKTKLYQAAQPDKIIDYIEERDRELHANKENVLALLPQLIALQKGAPKSEAQIFLGFKGIQTVSEGTYKKLKRGEEFYGVGISAYQDEKYHLYWQRDHPRRIKAGIKCRLMFNENTDPKILKNRNSYKKCDARYMPSEFKTPAWFLVYKDTVAIILQEEEIAVEIVNQKIADSFMSYCDSFWKKSKPFVAPKKKT
jgi:HTH-type transcriptional regulator, sugar sensing transcriptional regulator